MKLKSRIEKNLALLGSAKIRLNKWNKKRISKVDLISVSVFRTKFRKRWLKMAQFDWSKGSQSYQVLGRLIKS